MQDATELAGVQEVLATPTSIGGIRGRGVNHAIDLIEATYNEGMAKFVAGSDISGFFTRIRQSDVVEFVRNQTDDFEFVELFANALKVDLANADELDSDELRMFPTDDLGVAQGCPLSAFAGNLVLRHFDTQLNGKGIRCIRYIDDFIILGERRAFVAKAFESAAKLLDDLGMSIYRPEDRPDKSFFGEIGAGYEFLGYQIRPGVYLTRRATIEDLAYFSGDEQDFLSLYLTNGFCMDFEALSEVGIAFANLDKAIRVKKVPRANRREPLSLELS